VRRLLPSALALAVTAAFLVGSPASAVRGTPGGSAGSSAAAHRAAVATLARVQALLDGPGATHRSRPARPVDATMALRNLWRARPDLTGSERAAADRLLRRGGAAAATSDSFGGPYECQGAFCVHWLTAGPDAAPPTDADVNGIPDQVDTTLATLNQVLAVEHGTLGFRAPLPDTAANPGPPSCRPAVLTPCGDDPTPALDVYLEDLGSQGVYGFCSVNDPSSSSREQPAFCALDNDFATNQFGAVPLNALRVTVAHELFHAVQYAYDAGEPRWFMEGSAVWMEDVVFNAINDYLQYVPVSPIRRPLTPFTNDGQFGVYGSFTIFKFLTSYLRDPNAVRQAWDAASIERGHTALQSVVLTLTAHHQTPRLAFATFGAWNTLPAGSYPEASTYRPAGAWHLKTLKKGARKAGTWKVRLVPLSNAPAVLLPGRSLSKHSKVRITVKGPDVAAGGAATLQVRYRSGAVSLRQFGLNRKGDRTRTVTFNPKKVSSVVVVLTNGATSGPARAYSISAKAS
jgi:hypothetical protein